MSLFVLCLFGVKDKVFLMFIYYRKHKDIRDAMSDKAENSKKHGI